MSNSLDRLLNQVQGIPDKMPHLNKDKEPVHMLYAPTHCDVDACPSCGHEFNYVYNEEVLFSKACPYCGQKFDIEVFYD